MSDVTPAKPRSIAITTTRLGRLLSTRKDGACARERVDRTLGRPRPIGALTLDFAGIDAMTLLYADEFLGRLYGAFAVGDMPAGGVRLAGLNEETRYTVSACLQRRRLCALDGDQDVLLGYTVALEDTYRAARRLEEFRAGELAEALGLTATAVNNRLARLVQAGALTREQVTPEHGGREYVYRALADSVAGS